jgi:uncharacterized protein (DUF362 family)
MRNCYHRYLERNETAVAFAQATSADYDAPPPKFSAPELPGAARATMAAHTVRQLLLAWGLDAHNAGTAAWNPLGDFIEPGSRVTLKPNWVLHKNEANLGLDCLFTHTSVIEAVLEYVALAHPSSIVIGDAPIQKCALDLLLEEAGVNAMVERFRSRGIPVDIRDFRRTIMMGDRLGSARSEETRGVEHYVLFDLGRESLLEPIASDYQKFRVTMYNPHLLQRTHSIGRHQYLIAREVIETDTVINLPKLKCHRKAGITGALKNLVGINGNKEFLPHHRKGGEGSGGDCYEGRSVVKGFAESLADWANTRPAGSVQATLDRLSEICVRVAARVGHVDDNLEGAWHGNDTVWRMCLDLQRLLHYGTAGATLAPQRQRNVITITDAIIGGEGEGPLAPAPVRSGFLTGGANTAAVEWVNALLMGLDPLRIPLTAHAFDPFSYPLAGFDHEQIQVHRTDGMCPISDVPALSTVHFRPSRGWVGHCEISTHPVGELQPS